MKTICDWLAYDHKRCDDLFARADGSVVQRDWEQAALHFLHFHQALERHLVMEESILFPAFRNAVPNAAGPLGMLHVEHGHIRGMAERIHEALSRSDPVDFMIHSETFALLMQQHSLKEEDMLYPMLDRLLSAHAADIVRAMREAIEIDIAV